MIGSKSLMTQSCLTNRQVFSDDTFGLWLMTSTFRKSEKVYHDNNIGLIFLMGIVNLLPYL